jgi:hypothetical protein
MHSLPEIPSAESVVTKQKNEIDIMFKGINPNRTLLILTKDLNVIK